jgi:Flp pilus assembly protein TadB
MTAALTFTGIALVIAGVTATHPVPLVWGPGVVMVAAAYWLSLTAPERARRKRENRRGGYLR